MPGEKCPLASTSAVMRNMDYACRCFLGLCIRSFILTQAGKASKANQGDALFLAQDTYPYSGKRLGYSVSARGYQRFEWLLSTKITAMNGPASII